MNAPTLFDPPSLFDADTAETGELVVLVPCSADKSVPTFDPATMDRAPSAPAGELYTGSFHRYARQHAERLGARVVIVSALYGLVELDRELHGYELSIDEAERRSTGLAQFTTRTTHQARRLGLLDESTTVVSFLPKKYAEHVRAAGVDMIEPLAGSRGIGEHRGRIARVELEDLRR